MEEDWLPIAIVIRREGAAILWTEVRAVGMRVEELNGVDGLVRRWSLLLTGSTLRSLRKVRLGSIDILQSFVGGSITTSTSPSGMRFD
jgi:hypothetical protein